MNAQLRVVDTGLASGRWNTALSSALLGAARTASTDAVLRFYRFAPCVLLGASEDVPPSIASYCKTAGIELARRVTGGGSVYMAPSMLAWDVAIRRSGPIGDLSAKVGSALAQGLRDLDIRDVTSSGNAIFLGGRKVSGAAMTSRDDMLLYQGTLLQIDEAAPMAAALGMPLDVLSPQITSLAAETANPPDTLELQRALAKQLAAHFHLTPIDARLSPQEEDMARRDHAREIGTEAFVHGEDLLIATRVQR